MARSRASACIFAVLALVFSTLLFAAGAWANKVEEDALRQEALSKLPKPLEQMRVKELQDLLKERGLRRVSGLCRSSCSRASHRHR
jgi:hypothetical protein